MSKIKSFNHDKLVSDEGSQWTEDSQIYFMDVRTNIIQSFEQWKAAFSLMDDPCKWYNCSDQDCINEDHPECLEPDECFLVEMEIIGFDERSSPIWERV